MYNLFLWYSILAGMLLFFLTSFEILKKKLLLEQNGITDDYNRSGEEKKGIYSSGMKDFNLSFKV